MWPETQTRQLLNAWKDKNEATIGNLVSALKAINNQTAIDEITKWQEQNNNTENKTPKYKVLHKDEITEEVRFKLKMYKDNNTDMFAFINNNETKRQLGIWKGYPIYIFGVNTVPLEFKEYGKFKITKTKNGKYYYIFHPSLHGDVTLWNIKKYGLVFGGYHTDENGWEAWDLKESEISGCYLLYNCYDKIYARVDSCNRIIETQQKALATPFQFVKDPDP
mmetsp:Transcript_6230/g.8684  ORF Transcript_6230/g.8684 Transcript_6230/m.8684 type:complete len:221 (+) Transcript_6230:564-1226(+)